MKNVRPHCPQGSQHLPGMHKIRRSHLTLHGCANKSERQAGSDFRKKLIFMRTAGGGIADDTQFMTFSSLRLAEVADVAENSSHRRAKAMDYTQGSLPPGLLLRHGAMISYRREFKKYQPSGPACHAGVGLILEQTF